MIGAIVGTRVLLSLLYGGSATDAMTFILIPPFLLGVALFAA